MYIPQAPIPAAGVDANIWWLGRELDGIRQAIQAQGTAIQAQGAALEAKMENVDKRLTAVEMTFASWKTNFGWIAVGFAVLEFVLANKETVIGILESIGKQK